MRIISRFLIPAILVLFFATLPTIAYSKEPESVRIPQKSNLSCDGAIESVKQDLKKRGAFSEWKIGRQIIRPRVTWNAEPISKSYYGYPSDRLKAVTIGPLSTENRRSPSSPVPITAMGARIMAACNQVGMVNFTAGIESSFPVGYFPDRTARGFEWVDLFGAHQRSVRLPDGSSQNLYEWGYYYSP